MKTSLAIPVAAQRQVDGPQITASTDVAIMRRAFRQVWLGAVVCALVFGGTIAASALSYAASFPTEASRQQLLTVTTGSSGLAVLLGPLSGVDTVGGYTFYKSWVTLTAIGAIWAVLAATKLFRGEEESGRWALLLSAGTRASRATFATLLAIGGSILVIFAGTAVLTILVGRSQDVAFEIRESLILALSLCLAPAVFAGVGAFTAQLCRTRRLAVGLALGVFGVSLALRMIGDAGANEHWVLWLSPLGWTDLMQPFRFDDLRPLVPAGLTVLALGISTTWLAARRDVGDGLLASRDASEVRSFGLRSSTGLAARLEVPVLAAWAAGAAAAGLLLGIIAGITTSATVPESVADLLDRFGVHGGFTLEYFGISFLLVATLVALIPASQLSAACSEETSGRLVHVLSRPTHRIGWLGGRLALAGTGVAAAGLLAGLGAWLGARTQGIDIGFATMVGAGVNVIPTALVALGIGAVVLALAPRAAAGAVYAVVGWSLIVDLLGSMVSSLSWLAHLNLFDAMAMAPAETLQPTPVIVSVLLAIGLCGTALIVFDRRDLKGS